MKIKKTVAAIAFALSAFVSAPAWAEYPEKPVTLIVWSSAGSGHDLMARYIAKVGEEFLGQPIVVVNKKGGKGKVAMSYVLNQKADGHVIMTNTRSMTERLKKTGDSIAIDSFKYISRMVKDPFVILVNENSPFKTLEDMLAYAKQNPNKLKMGGYSSKSVDSGLADELMEKSESKINYIPYKGGKEPVVAVLGGHIDAAIANPSEMLANFEAGKLRVLAVASEERFSPFDESPTLIEKGYDIVTEHWRGVMASKDLPSDIVTKIEQVMEKVASDEEFEKFLKTANMYNGFLPSEKFTDLVVQQTKN